MYQNSKHFPFLFAGSTRSLHEHPELGLLCSTEADPSSTSNGGRLEKRSYLPPVSCTDAHEINAVTAKVHCQPRPRVVALPWPNDTSVHQVGRWNPSGGKCYFPIGKIFICILKYFLFYFKCAVFFNICFTYVVGTYKVCPTLYTYNLCAKNCQVLFLGGFYA